MKARDTLSVATPEICSLKNSAESYNISGRAFCDNGPSSESRPWEASQR